MLDIHQYKAFISYSHQDSKVAAWLHRRIEAFRPRHALSDPSLPEKLSPVFKDREELPSAANLSTVIEDAMSASAFLIVLCSPSAAKSPWVNQEIQHFKMLHGDQRVLAYIVDGEPQGPNSCFPKALLHPVLPDGSLDESISIEPVAADQRPHADGRTNASQKIIAGMLGVGFDRIHNREQQIRQRRLLSISIFSTLGFVVAVALAATAFIARNQAEAQRQRAEIEAQTARRTSNFLIDIFTVASPSEARGQQVTAAEILKRGVTQIEQLDNEPAIQGNLLHTMGLTHLGLGLYNQSSSLLTQALSVRKRAGANYTVSQASLAEALMYAGNYDQAIEEISYVISTLPADEWSALHSLAYNVDGDIKVKQQKLDEAEASYQTALQGDQVFALKSDNNDWNAHIARSESGLGTILFHRQKFADAIPHLERSLKHYQAAYGELHPQVAVTYNNLGSANYFLQRWPEVIKNYELALPLARALLGEEHPEVAALLNNSGRLKLENGNPDEGAVWLDQAVHIYRGVPNAETGNLIYALNSLALAKIDQKDYAAAIELQNEALALNLTTHRIAGPLLINHALAQCLEDKKVDVTGQLAQAKTQLKTHYPAEDWRFSWLSVVEYRCGVEQDRTQADTALAALEKLKGDQNWFTKQARLN